MWLSGRRYTFPLKQWRKMVANWSETASTKEKKCRYNCFAFPCWHARTEEEKKRKLEKINENEI